MFHVHRGLVDADNLYRRFLVNESVGRLHLDDVSVEIGIANQRQSGDTHALIAGFQVHSLKRRGTVVKRFLQRQAVDGLGTHEPPCHADDAQQRDSDSEESSL